MKTLDDKVRDACHRIEELYNETGGKCYVSFSGGKDSTVLLALIKLCEDVYTIPPNAIPAVFSNTGIELGVTVDFVKWVKDNYYQNVQIVRPVKPFAWVLENKGKPMLSKVKSKMMNRHKKRGYFKDGEYHLLILGETRAHKKTQQTKIADKYMHLMHADFPIMPSDDCCTYMKKKPFEKYAKENDMKGALQGIRYEEGGARAVSADRRIAQGGKLCTWIKGGIIQKAPMIDWTEEDVEQFIEKYDVPLSDAYTVYGFDRTGCMACPYSKRVDHDLQYLHDHEPNRYRAAMHWLKDVYIAQDVRLPFDEAYERERERAWREKYEPMRQEMLRKYRPKSRLIKDDEQMTIFDYIEE